MSEQLAKIVDSIRNFEPILELLQRKSPVTLDHVCEGAQAFVAACALSGIIASRSCWILCPDVRRQEDIFNGLLNWQIDALFFPEIELPAVQGIAFPTRRLSPSVWKFCKKLPRANVRWSS